MTKALRTIDKDPIENLASVFDVMYPKREEINRAFKRFITHNEDPRQFDYVRDEVAESWLRSRNCGVTMDRDLLKKKVKPSTLKRILKDNQSLIEIVESMLSKDLAFLRHHSDFSVYLYDRNGIVLSFFTSKKVNIHHYLGADFSEQSIGTSAHSLSIFLDKPFLIIPTENFNSDIQHVSAAISVPIHNPKGDVIGALTFAYPEENDLYLSNLGMLSGMISFQMSLVKKMENTLKTISENNALFSTISSLTNDSLIAINKAGKIKNMNNMAEKLLGASFDDFKGKSIAEVIGDETQLINVLSTNKRTSDLPAKIISNGKKKDCVIRVVPFDLNEGALIRLTQPAASSAHSFKDHCENLSALYSFSDILGDSPELAKSKRLAEKFAAMPRNILLLGESGTGKELFANAIHNASRAQGPFITINCASLPRGLVESEFFGYEAGSFTGADRKGRAGKLEMANGGTLFLDEIGDMPLGFQPILLRVLEDKRVMRIGSNHYIPTNFRVVAATNKNLQELIAQNLFREDLYYRLSSLKVLIPSLKSRRNDIPILARHFIRKHCQEYQLPIPTIEPDVDQALLSYDWPGNIRELQNAICTALCLAEDGVIKVMDLPIEITNNRSDVNHTYPLKTLDELKKQAIHDAMISTGFNVEKAALTLGISRSSLYQKLSELQNAIETASFLSEAGMIDTTNHLFSPDINDSHQLKSLEELEEQAIHDAMISTGHNVEKAALALGISRSSLYQKLKEYNINTKSSRSW